LWNYGPIASANSTVPSAAKKETRGAKRLEPIREPGREPGSRSFTAHGRL
jgi:hypothetical protein